MKLKIILLPRKLTSRPIPYWDIGSIISNIKDDYLKIELKDLETLNYESKKYDIFFIKHEFFQLPEIMQFQFLQMLIKDIGDLNYDLFYFYIDWWNETLPAAIALGKRIKSLNITAKILISGPYLDCYGKEVLNRFRFIDYIGVSEMEPVFKKLSGTNNSPGNVPNIVFLNKEKNKIVETKKEITDLNKLNFPDFDLFFYGRSSRPKILPFRISRGCRYRCFFCACLTAEKLRFFRNIDNVTSKLFGYITRYKIEDFYFNDDALNFDNNYLELFLDKLIRKKIGIKWSAYFVPKNLPFKLLEKIKNSGCVHIRWGIESVNHQISERISKNIFITEVEKILKDTNSLGISNQISLIVGFPFEREDSITLMKKFIFKNRRYLRVVNAYTFKPRVGTLAYKFPGSFDIEILKDKAIFKKDEVPFDEKKGLKWEAKRIQQQLFLKEISSFIKSSKLKNIDPHEYFTNLV